MQYFRKGWLYLAAGFAALFGLLPFAFADAVTTAAASAASTFSSDGNQAMGAIGAAIIGVAVIAVLFKWVKGMFFG
ncbi:hypothetical protein [Thiomonas arsenitoxydans]|uniref:hypothetical protein n=1 Tax=Thiomonas arsenitoxydans (strain DSM 22701 / CIP 110005 / 3As) TaxID=426114 RepID=UPI001AC3BE30|nr:hypothetical protein [Thiomonas arsenitoxydans]MBN8776749.1 hypothetical protein [Thiomonas arsenitoxydans]